MNGFNDYHRIGLCAALAAALLTMTTTGCGRQASQAVTADSSGLRPADDDLAADRGVADQRQDATSGRVPVQPAPLNDRDAPDRATGRLEVPDGSPAELLQYIDELGSVLREAVSTGKAGQDAIGIMAARVQAADMILAKRVSADIRNQAVESKLESLRMMAMFDPLGARDGFHDYALSLVEEDDPTLSKMGKLALFQLQVDEFASGEAGDAPGIMTKLQTLVGSKDAGPSEFITARHAAVTLARAGHQQEAATALKLIGAAFLTNADQALASEAKILLEEAQLLEFQGQIVDVLSAEPGAEDRLMAAVRQLLGKPAAGGRVLAVTRQAAQILEHAGHVDEAKEIYSLVGSTYQNHSDADLANQAIGTVDLASRRLGLIGKPLNIEGVTRGGATFDWKKYKGKVVLIDFWASWCGPCLEELPNIKRNYERYRDQGFEVVGVNLDEDPGAVEQFFGSQEIPWATVMSDNPDARGLDNVNAARCGVDAIPFMVLVGRDGNVSALHSRGERLNEQLAEIFDDQEKQDAATSPDDSAAGDAPQPGGVTVD